MGQAGRKVKQSELPPSPASPGATCRSCFIPARPRGQWAQQRQLETPRRKEGPWEGPGDITAPVECSQETTVSEGTICCGPEQPSHPPQTPYNSHSLDLGVDTGSLYQSIPAASTSEGGCWLIATAPAADPLKLSSPKEPQFLFSEMPAAWASRTPLPGPEKPQRGAHRHPNTKIQHRWGWPYSTHHWL